MKYQKVIVPLSEEEHAKLKAIATSTRRTLGREMAFLAFQAAAPLPSSKPRTRKEVAA